MFIFEVLPRFSETDANGHINNTALPIWFEEARRELFKLFNPTLDLKNWNLIVKKYEIDFLKQVNYVDNVRIETWLENIGKSSMLLVQVAKQKGIEVANAKTIMIHFDYKLQKSAFIPQEIRIKLEPHLLPST